MAGAEVRPRAERRALREQMRSLGFGHREIATEFARRYNLRPRTAWREAHGWSLKEAAERINAYAAGRGLDPTATAAMTGPHLCEAESWPGYAEKPSGRRPSPYLLSLLAAVYGCTVMDLADLADRQRMPPSELLILEKYSQSPPVLISDSDSLARCQPPLSTDSDGHNAAQLHLYRGLAAAHIGDADTARRAITAASQARERDHNDELLEIGGEFGFSRAAHHYYAGFTLTDVPGATADAVNELEHAAELYAAGPGPGEDHSHKCWMLAHADLATAWLRATQLDAAVTALEPVLALSPGNRTAVLAQRLTVLRAELAGPHYQGSPQARELDERIEEFRRETIVSELHTLHGSPA